MIKERITIGDACCEAEVVVGGGVDDKESGDIVSSPFADGFNGSGEGCSGVNSVISAGVAAVAVAGVDGDVSTSMAGCWLSVCPLVRLSWCV